MEEPRRVLWLGVVVVASLVVAGALFMLRKPPEPAGQALGRVPGPGQPFPAPFGAPAAQPGLVQPFAVPSKPLVGHPRLFFTKDDIPALRQQAETTHKEIWQPILILADSQLGKGPPAMPQEFDLEGFRNSGEQLIAFAFAYVVTGEKQYFELTRQHLLAIAAWPYWGDEQGYGSRDLGFHAILMGSSIAYDWVFNDLSPEDRRAIATVLATRTQESFEASRTIDSPWNNWWRKAYTHNHHWNNHSALGIAALTLDGEDPRAESWLQQAADNLRRDTFALQQIGDGTWHESTSYEDYIFTTSLPFLHNLKKLKGLDLIPHDFLRNYTLWRVYNSLPGTGRSALPFGDQDPNWGGSPHGPEGILRFIAREYKDGRAEWMARHILANSGRSASVYNAPLYVFEFLYYDPGVAPQPPEGLPLSRAFSDLQGVIWRTGWGENDLVFSFKTGPPGGRFFYDAFMEQKYPFDLNSGVDYFHSGHEHLDANGFNLFRGKVDLASETAGYNKVAMSYHNTVLVDGNAMVDGNGGHLLDPNVRNPRDMMGRDARLEAVGEASNFNYLIADAAGRYGGAINEFRRYVLFVRPGYLVIVDSLGSGSPRRYEWVSHFGKSVGQEGGWLKGQTEGDDVIGVRIVEPSDFAVTNGEDGKPYARVRPSTDVQATRFATVLFPTTSRGWADKPEITSLGDNGQAIGVRVTQNGIQDHLIGYGRAGGAILGDYSFDGKVSSVSKGPDGSLRNVFLGQGSRLADGGGARVLIQAPGQVTALEVSYQGASLAVSGNVAGGLRIFAPGVDPQQVSVNGQQVQVSQNGDYVELRG